MAENIPGKSKAFDKDKKPLKKLTATELKKIIQKKTKEILESTENKLERAIVLDFYGNVIIDKTGSEDKVTFTVEETELMKNAAVLIHNHPSGTSFSWKDLELTHELNIKEIQAIAFMGINGPGTYVIRDISEIDLKLLYDEFMKVGAEEDDKIWEKISDEEITPRQGTLMHLDCVYKILKSSLNLKYEWQELK